MIVQSQIRMIMIGYPVGFRVYILSCMKNSENKRIVVEAPFKQDIEEFRRRFDSYLENNSTRELNIHEVASVLHSIAQSYLMEGKPDEAETHFQEAIELYKKTEDEYSLAFCMSQYALILRHQSKREDAECVLMEVIKLSKKLKLKRKDVKRWFLECYFQNLLEIFNGKAEVKELKKKLEAEWKSR